jgi:hypothetical protein
MLLIHYLNNKVSVYPYYSKVKNIGYSKEGTHCKSVNVHQIKFDKSNKRDFVFLSNININDNLNKYFLNYFSKSYKIIYRIKLLKNFRGTKLLFEDLWQKIKQRFTFAD